MDIIDMSLNRLEKQGVNSLTPSGVPVHCAHFPSQLVSPTPLAQARTGRAERLAYVKLDLITALQQAVSLPQV
ncbi:hypothetical protein Q7C36_005551 [Tachysurus vachellii]|uniref:Uncharacterized protein n=1 Tax=Tachysurus vachellii TaxID=175792 RepID=A0AA88NK83_TACVA|nr:hypothetical protein Q7C36_005551 [Tachysurus vachellii]